MATRVPSSNGRESWVFRAADPSELLGRHVAAMAAALEPGEELLYLLYAPIYDGSRTAFGLRCEPASHAFAVTSSRFVLSTDQHRDDEAVRVVSVPFDRILAVEWGDSLLQGWVALHFADGDVVDAMGWMYPATVGRKRVERMLRAYRAAIAPAEEGPGELPHHAELVGIEPLLSEEIEPLLLEEESILVRAATRELWSSPGLRKRRVCLSTAGMLTVSEAGIVYGEHAPSLQPNPLNFGLRGRTFPWQAFAGWTDQGDTSGLRLVGLRLARGAATSQVAFAVDPADAGAILRAKPPMRLAAGGARR
jgi:hypothetical protein